MAELAVSVHEGDHIRGMQSAPVTLVMYGDYECPYTRQAYRVVQRLLTEDQETSLRFVFRHFPLTRIHPHAQHAAEAAEAAAAQGAFWEMHDTLFTHREALEDADLQRYAQELGLDAQRHARELAAHVYAGRVQQDVRSGLASGVQGTPTLYFNGQLHVGDHDAATLGAIVVRLAHDASQSTT